MGNFIQHGDIQFSILLFLVGLSFEIHLVEVLVVEIFQLGIESAEQSSSLGHLTLRFFTGSIALSSPCLINWVAFLTKAANSFFESSVSSLALFFQDLLLPLPFWLAPLLPFNFLACVMSVLHSEVSWVLLWPCNTQCLEPSASKLPWPLAFFLLLPFFVTATTFLSPSKSSDILMRSMNYTSSVGVFDMGSIP